MIPGILYSQLIDSLEQDPKTNYWSISKEIRLWMFENNIIAEERRFEIEGGSDQYGLYFEAEEDYMAFRLRWL